MKKLFFQILLILVTLTIGSCSPDLTFDETQITYDKDIKVGDTLKVPLLVDYTGDPSDLVFTASKGVVEENSLIYVTDSSDIGFNNEIDIVVSDGELTDELTATFDVLPFHELKVGDTWKYRNVEHYDSDNIGTYITIINEVIVIKEITQIGDSLKIIRNEASQYSSYWHTSKGWIKDTTYNLVNDYNDVLVLDSSHIGTNGYPLLFTSTLVDNYIFQDTSFNSTNDSCHFQKITNAITPIPPLSYESFYEDRNHYLRNKIIVSPSIGVIAISGLANRYGDTYDKYWNNELISFNDKNFHPDSINIDSLLATFE